MIAISSRSLEREAPALPTLGARLRRGERLLGWLFSLPAVLVLFVVTIFPFLFSLAVSFHAWDLRRGIEWQFVGLNNYAAILRDDRFWSAVGNTFRLGLSALLLEFLLGFALALLLNREFRFKRLYNTLLILPVMISPIVVGLVNITIYNDQFGAVNGILRQLGFEASIPWLADRTLAYIVIVLTDTWQWTPLVMMILLAGLQSLPQEPYEAARVDGASWWQSFWHLTLPLLRGPIAVALLIRFIDVLKLFDVPYIMTGGGPGGSNETLSIYIYLTGFRYQRMGFASAQSYVLLIITIILTTLFIRVSRRREEMT